MPLESRQRLGIGDLPRTSGQQQLFQGGQRVIPQSGGGTIQARQRGGGGGTDPFTQQRQQMGNFINNPGQALTNYQDTLQQVQQLPYGAGAWNLGDALQQGGGGQVQPPSQLNVTTGIQPQVAPQAPQAVGTPQLGAMSPMQAQAAQASFGQAAQPQLAQLLSQYYPAAQGLESGTQNAQAASALGWAGLGSQGANQAQGNQVAQNTQLVQFLQGAGGIFG